MVFEYMDHDLTGILNNSAAVYTVPHIKCLASQLFSGLAYLHSQNIIHRDVKGAFSIGTCRYPSNQTIFF